MPIHSFSFASSCLADNPLGDPALRDVWVWEPVDAAHHGPLPVLYGLTGFTGRGEMLLHDSPWSPGLHRRLDRLYDEKQIPPMRVVLPDCFTRYGGSQYVNSTATGAYRDYVTREVVSAVESRYPVRPGREHRFLFGKSSGGFGALSIGLDHPDLYGGLACQSGDMAFEYCYLPDFPHTIEQLEAHGGLQGFLDAFHQAPKKTYDLIRAMNVIAMAACYSPSVDKPGTFELPFDLSSGKLREDVWQRWLALDPIRRVESRLDALASMNVLFLDCGTHDEFNLHLGARMLNETLEKHGIRHEYQEFPDGHLSISYRYEASIVALGKAWA